MNPAENFFTLAATKEIGSLFSSLVLPDRTVVWLSGNLISFLFGVSDWWCFRRGPWAPGACSVVSVDPVGLTAATSGYWVSADGPHESAPPLHGPAGGVPPSMRSSGPGIQCSILCASVYSYIVCWVSGLHSSLGRVTGKGKTSGIVWQLCVYWLIKHSSNNKTILNVRFCTMLAKQFYLYIENVRGVVLKWQNSFKFNGRYSGKK